ncbi:MAG: aldo/keto reductase [Clostridiales bacterium]|jgi:predicted oxidoreductase|nr:aldo/keto reductase [Clostridiales bacterium]
MKQIRVGGKISAPQVVLGCMRLPGAENPERLVKTAIDGGVNFFDHADIYGGGESERVFGRLLNLRGADRAKVTIQSKCGIRNGFFDFSKEHILKSVDGILERLGTEYLDALLLHRPDNLMEPEEIAEAFDKLKTAGKVRNFGVSNFNVRTVELLKTAVKDKLIINQLQYSPVHAFMSAQSLTVNNDFHEAADRDGGILEYCRINNITVQAWSPFQYGLIKGAYLDNADFPEINAALLAVAEKYNITKTGAVAAWIARHPADMQIIAGTTKPERLKEIICGASVDISREEWYTIYRAGGFKLP